LFTEIIIDNKRIYCLQ